MIITAFVLAIVVGALIEALNDARAPAAPVQPPPPPEPGPLAKHEAFMARERARLENDPR